MIYFDKSPTWPEMKAALGIVPDAHPGVTVGPVFANFGMHGEVIAIDLKAETGSRHGRERYLRRAVKITCPNRKLQFDDDAYRAKLAELIPVGAEARKGAEASAARKADERAKMDVIGARVNAACPDGIVFRMSGEWTLKERPRYSTRFVLDHFQLDPPDDTPVFDLRIRGLNEEQLVKLLRLSTSLKELP